MSYQKTGYGRLATWCCCAAALAFVGTASAAEILTGGANVEQSDVYVGGAWNISAGTGVNSSTLIAPGTAFPNQVWNYSGTIEWTGNALINDYSTVAGQARGEFGGGGAFKLHGSVMDGGFPQSAVPGYQDVDLIIGTVSGFTVEESGAGTDNFDTIIAPVLTVTGGALVTGAGPQFMLAGSIYEMDVSMLSATNGLAMDDFINSPYIFINGGTVINLFRIPEPASLSLMVVGAALAMRNRRRRGR